MSLENLGIALMIIGTSFVIVMGHKVFVDNPRETEKWNRKLFNDYQEDGGKMQYDEFIGSTVLFRMANGLDYDIKDKSKLRSSK